ncbi:MAG: hypothetical protein J6V11_00365 [Alphaproteobacteria bacterium]|nr:hypothetical protein [Alphaproteobacteria bacterium]
MTYAANGDIFNLSTISDILSHISRGGNKLKIHDLKSAVIDSIAINYFYTKEKNDINGNPRFTVYIMDPDTSAIYQTAFKGYDSQIKNHVINFINSALEA